MKDVVMVLAGMELIFFIEARTSLKSQQSFFWSSMWGSKGEDNDRLDWSVLDQI